MIYGLAALGFLGGVAVYFYLQALRSRKITRAGLKDGQLRGCGRFPNCVRSSVSAELPVVREALEKMGARFVTEADGYIHAEFRSLLFGFVDDFECLADGDVVHLRARSRVGVWDLSANRRRVKALHTRVGVSMSQPG